MEQNLRKMIFFLPKLFGKHKQWTILQILFLLLVVTSANAESYYIVNPNAKFGMGAIGTDISGKKFGFTEWLQLTPVEGSCSKYTVILPAYFPSSVILGNEQTLSDQDIIDYYNHSKDEDGFTFAIATKTQIESIAEKYKDEWKGGAIDIPSDVKKELIVACGNNKSKRTYGNDNYWVYENVISGTLSTLGEDNSYPWEIKKPVEKDSYTSDDLETVYRNPHLHVYLKDDYCLDGAYKLTIDVSTNTWTMEYLSDTRVSYLAMMPQSQLNTNLPNYPSGYQSYITYTFTQTKTGDKFNNIYYNPCVYLYGDKANLLFFSPAPPDYDNAYQIGEKYTSTNSLDNAMLNAYENYSANGFSYYGSSYSGSSIHVNGSACSIWGHVLFDTKPADISPLEEQGSYFSIKWYPYVNATGIIKIGDGEDASADKPKFNTIYICESKDHKGNSATGTESKIKMNYDVDAGVYYKSLSNFKNGYFSFKGKVGSDVSDIVWNEDADVQYSPNSEVNADYLKQKGTDETDNEILYSADPAIADGESVNIYFKIGTADDGVTPTYKYWVSRPTVSQTVDINYLLGEHIRTYSNSLPYDIKDNSNVKIYVVKSFGVAADKEDGAENKYDNVATATLKQIRYIPAYTGVVLLNNTDNTTNTDPITVTLTPHTVTGKETAVGTNYLVPTLCEQYVNASLMKQHVRVARNFFLGSRGECTDLTEGQTINDYIGFFRAMNYTLCHENYAYLQIPVSYVETNIQLTGKGDLQTIDFSTASGAKGINFVFEDLDDNTDVTGVSEITVNDTTSDDSYYTLSGIKVQSPTHGLYIHCGKKLYLK